MMRHVHRPVDPFTYCRPRGIAIERAAIPERYLVRHEGARTTIVLSDALSFDAQQAAIVAALRSSPLIAVSSERQGRPR